MTVYLKNNALTTLAAVKSELNIPTATTTNDQYLTRAINACSDKAALYCGRSFRQQTKTDEEHPGKGGRYLNVDVTPLTTLTNVKYNGDALDSTEYEIYNANVGTIYKVNGSWYWTAAAQSNIGQDGLPGTERKLYTMTYVGGYVLPKDGAAAVVTGTGTENFTFAGGEDLVISTNVGDTTCSTGGNAGQTAVEVAAIINTAFDASNDEVTASASGTVVVLTHNGTADTDYIEVNASAAATTLGLSTTQTSGTRTLPWDLEQACIDMINSQYWKKGNTKDIKSEKLLTATYTYGNTSGDSPYSVDIMSVLNSYKRYVV